jgi:protein-histidine N-methyltransferase
LCRPDSATNKIHFTFADYNSAVLRLVTLPNLLLTWNYIATHRDTTSREATSSGDQPDEEELDLTPELLESFQRDLASRKITFGFISGAWSPAFVDLVFSSYGQGKGKILILASETIYSPASLAPFSETLIALLRRSETEQVRSEALIAAKKVYFGVGGGVDEFLTVLRNLNGNGLDIEEQVNINSEGVGRVILKIAPRST